MTAWLRRLHRWVGLATAPFLVLAGLTGAVLPWEHELDAILAPAFSVARTDGAPLPPLALADALEAAEPDLRVTWLPLDGVAGEAVVVGVTGRAGPLPFDQVALDPATAEVQGRRRWGEPAWDAAAVMPFVYRLHYSLHLTAPLPAALGGLEAGVAWMGLVAIAWTLDGLVALALSFPNPRQWRRSFAFRLREGALRAVFDVHRSGGVWLWPLLVGLAVTAVSMNLGDAVVRPLVALVSPVAPEPWDRPDTTAEPVRSRAEIVAAAVAEAERRGIGAPPGGLFLSPAKGLAAVGFYGPGQEHGDGGLGNPWLFVDAASGAVVAAEVPGEGSAGDTFLALQFPLHSGRIAGVPGRIAVTAFGLAVAVLGVTGPWLWARRSPWFRAQARGSVAPSQETRPATS